MLTQAERQTLRKKLTAYEGQVDHMYLDTAGYVTVGVGHMMADVSAAQKLPFLDAKGKHASAADIKVDYDAVKKQAPGRLAVFYKRFTKLHLAQAEIDRLTNQHIDSFYKELKIIYKDFDKFPSEAKLALMDMIFNLGMTNLKNRWPKFNKAVQAKDWAAAAKESNRKAPISAARNQYVRDLFNQAAAAPAPAKANP